MHPGHSALVGHCRLELDDLGALGGSPHGERYPMTPAARSRAIVLSL